MTASYDQESGLGARETTRLGAAPFALLRLAGPDAEDFLQRLCSQDVAGLASGAAAPAAFLDPKGKLVGTCFAARLDGAFWLVCQDHQAAAILEVLDRYHFTEKVELGRVDGIASALVHGPQALAGTGLAPGQAGRDAAGVLRIAITRAGQRWLFAFGPAAGVAAVGAGLPELDAEGLELRRIAAGLVRVGVDTEPGTLALEANLDDHVSTTKGCYTGQEIVARIHTYGHVNRRLTLLRLATDDEVEVGTPLCETEDGDPVGRVMSSAPLPAGGRLGLGYLPADFWEPGTTLTLGAAGGAAVQVLAFGDA